MKIRIIKEQKNEPVSVQNPFSNSDFTDIHSPPTNKIIPSLVPQRLQVFMNRQVHEMIWQHISSDTSLELGGALLGYYAEWKQQKFLIITDVFIQPVEYFASPVMIKFTNRFYDELENSLAQIKQNFPSVVRLGLFHSHPNYGVYMSKTDALDFKRTITLSYQIAMIFDPVRQEDGLYFWSKENSTDENDISATSHYYLFHSSNPSYCPHKTESNEVYFASANPLVQFTGTLPDTSGLGKTLHHRELQPVNSFLSEEKKDSFEIQKPVIKNELNYTQDCVVMKCPLYDLTCNNESVQLLRYFKSLKNTNRHEFPYMIFLSKNIKHEISAYLKNDLPVAGVLNGKLGYDSEKETYFVFINEAILDIMPTQPYDSETMIDQLEKKLKVLASNTKTFIGWVFVSNGRAELPYLFYDLHKKLFSKSYHIGLLLTQTKEAGPDFNQLTIIAYDFLKQEPYNHYPHFFLFG